MAIKEIIKLIEYYIQTAGQSPLYTELVQDLKSKFKNIHTLKVITMFF